MIRAPSRDAGVNGSSSMVRSARLDGPAGAGIPVSSPVAGVAMGLIKEGDDYIVPTDIAGVEDHPGDMDFQVAGTADGINAIQMDIKITGVTFEILTDAPEQARRWVDSSSRQDGRSDRRPSREQLRRMPRASSRSAIDLQRRSAP